MFSKKEAVDFLQTSWGVKRVEERSTNMAERKILLEEIVISAQENIPFQSITLMATPPEQRRRPSLATIKEECCQGIGGLCYNINVFSWSLLKALGFAAHLCSATCTTTTTGLNNHIIVLVKDLEKKGDLHLVEVGCGFPTFRVISLDFKSESPTYVDSFLEYKYIRLDDKILRMHGEGDMIKRNDPPNEALDFFIGKWRRFYYFTIAPTDSLSTFDPYFDSVFTVPRYTPFDSSPRGVSFKGKRTVALVNNRMVMEKEKGKLEKTEFAGDDEIVAMYRQYFPTLKEEIVRKALQEWHRVQ